MQQFLRYSTLGAVISVAVTTGCGKSKMPDGLATNPQTTNEAAALPTAPALEFSNFLVLEDYPFAQLKFKNPTTKSIFFSGYGPTRPLQTWERLDDTGWTECGYEWCGTGRTTEELAPGDSIVITSDLRNFKTNNIPKSPLLNEYKFPMRVVLYYGFDPADIQHPVPSDDFSGDSQ